MSQESPNHSNQTNEAVRKLTRVGMAEIAPREKVQKNSELHALRKGRIEPSFEPGKGEWRVKAIQHADKWRYHTTMANLIRQSFTWRAMPIQLLFWGSVWGGLASETALPVLTALGLTVPAVFWPLLGLYVAYAAVSYVYHETRYLN